jgi:HlyD family secretion protein
MALADLERMEVLAEVDESEVVKVSLGDSATVEVDALPGQVFRGLVSEIANSGTTRGRGTAEEATHFEVKVAVVGDVTALRPGMSASVDVLTERRSAVLSVPIQCVTLRAKPVPESAGEPAPAAARRRPGEVAEAEAGPRREEQPAGGAGGLGLAGNLREVIYVVRDGIARELPVETGISSPTHIEIVAGEIEEGDEVVSGSYRVLSRELEDGAAVKVDNASLRRGGRGDDRESRAASSGRGSRDHG